MICDYVVIIELKSCVHVYLELLVEALFLKAQRAFALQTRPASLASTEPRVIHFSLCSGCLARHHLGIRACRIFFRVQHQHVILIATLHSSNVIGFCLYASSTLPVIFFAHYVFRIVLSSASGECFDGFFSCASRSTNVEFCRRLPISLRTSSKRCRFFCCTIPPSQRRQPPSISRFSHRTQSPNRDQPAFTRCPPYRRRLFRACSIRPNNIV